MKDAKVTQRGASGEDSFFELYTVGGGSLTLKCNSAIEADKWVDAIMERQRFYCSGDGSADAKQNVESKIVHISGWLLKKSHNKYQTSLQERFVVVEGDCLRYYKHEGDKEELGW